MITAGAWDMGHIRNYIQVLWCGVMSSHRLIRNLSKALDVREKRKMTISLNYLRFHVFCFRVPVFIKYQSKVGRRSGSRNWMGSFPQLSKNVFYAMRKLHHIIKMKTNLAALTFALTLKWLPDQRAPLLPGRLLHLYIRHTCRLCSHRLHQASKGHTIIRTYYDSLAKVIRVGRAVSGANPGGVPRRDSF